MTEIRSGQKKITEDRATFDAAISKGDALAAMNVLAGDLYNGVNQHVPTEKIQKVLDDKNINDTKQVSQEMQRRFQTSEYANDELRHRRDRSGKYF